MNFVDSSSTSAGSRVVAGMAIIAVLLGSAGLYAALSGRGAERAMEDRIAELEQRVERISGGLEELNGQVRGLHYNTRTALQTLNDQLTQVRQEMPASRGAPAPQVAPASTPAPASASAAKTYTIRAGDLIAKIARDHNTTVDAILRANPGLNPNRIKVGQVINIP